MKYSQLLTPKNQERFLNHGIDLCHMLKHSEETEYYRLVFENQERSKVFIEFFDFFFTQYKLSETISSHDFLFWLEWFLKDDKERTWSQALIKLSLQEDGLTLDKNKVFSFLVNLHWKGIMNGAKKPC